MNINRIIKGLTLGFVIMLSFIACQPEEFTMGEIISKDELSFFIYQDATDPNMIILKSGNPGMTPLWITPMGRSIRVQDTVRIPFAGEYFFIYGVQSAGGFVMADTFKLTLTTNNLMYVDHPLWTLLTGGVGHEKTWLLDLDANGVSKYFNGPLYFAGLDNNWSTITEGQEPAGGDGWIWEADWPGNQWMMPAADFGTMTFSLAGRASVTVNNRVLGVNETGTYFLDVDNKTLRMTDARPLHDAGRTGHVADWGALRLLSLTENTMQLAALRDPGLSGEGAVLLVYNFISKDYADNWEPPAEEEPVIELDLRGLTPEELLSVTTSTAKTWKVNTNTPFNWATLDGTLMNQWNNIADYPGWTGYNQAAAANIENIRLTFNLDGSVMFRDNAGTETEGTFSVDDANLVTFTGVSPAFNIAGWVNASTTAENQWQIVRIGRTGDVITDIWFGRRDPEKPEYMVYHFTLTAEGAGADPVTQARRDIILALAGTDSRSFRIDPTWPVDWGTATFTGGWTTAATFADFTSNTWMWTAAVRDSILSPRLTFSTDGFGNLTATRVQYGVTTTTIVGIDPINMVLTIDGGLLEFYDAASWMPVTNRQWKIVRTTLANVQAEGIWFATIIPKWDGTTESIMYRYIVAD